MVIEHTIIEYDSKHVKGVISKITVYISNISMN